MTHLSILWAFVVIGLALLAGTGGLLCFWLVAGWVFFGRKATPRHP